MKLTSLHKKDILLNKDKLENILDKRGMNYVSFLDEIKKEYGLDISYKGFMNLMYNRSTWKLLYAYAVLDVLKINLEDVFDIVEVDIDKKIKEKKEWNEKYGKSKKRGR